MENTKQVIDLGMPCHPLAELMPWIEGDEWSQFKESVAEGLREPIVIHEGVVIDGRKRLRACRELGIEPRFQELRELIEPEDDGEYAIDDFIYTRNMDRLHMGPTQRAAVVAAWSSMQAEIAAAERAKRLNLVAGARQKKAAGELPKKADSLDVDICPHRETDTELAQRTRDKVMAAAGELPSKTDSLDGSKPTHRETAGQTAQRTHEKVMAAAGCGERTARAALDVAKHAPEILPDVIAGKIELAEAAKVAKAKKLRVMEQTQQLHDLRREMARERRQSAWGEVSHHLKQALYWARIAVEDQAECKPRIESEIDRQLRELQAAVRLIA
jgi:hypothetical protein